MTRALFRDTLRAIRKTFSRFISIVIIVALGVGFFAGLKSVSPNMKKAADSFYEKHRLADIVLISTVGFDEQDRAIVLEQPGVASATLSRFFDSLLYEEVTFENEDGEEETELRVAQSMTGTGYVCRVIGYDFAQMAGSESDRLNQLEFVTGRLPVAPNECMVSAYEHRMDPAHYTIGSKLQLRGDHEDILDSLKYSEYTIVGVVYSPEFISMELGASQAGGGELSGYIYVPDEAFQMEDSYTTLYVGVEGTQSLDAYSKTYADRIRPVQDKLEEISSVVVKQRAERLRETYGPRLTEGKIELEQKRKEAAEGLAEAREEIKRLKEGVKEGPDAYRRDKEAAEKRLAAAQKEYEDGLIEYDKRTTEYNAGKKKFDEAKKMMDEHPYALAEYEEAQQKLERAQNSMEIAGIAVRAGKSAIKVGRSVLESGDQERLENALRMLAEFVPMEEDDKTFEGLQKRMEEAEVQLAEQEEAVAEGQAEIDAARKELKDIEPLIKQIHEYNDATATLAKAYQDLEAARKRLEAAPAEIEAGEKELARVLAQAQKDLANYSSLDRSSEKELAREEAEIQRQLADAERTIRRGENLMISLPNAQWLSADRDNFAGYTNYGNQADSMEAFALVFPMLFFLIAALVSLTTMTRMVEDERMQLGVLKAAGYSGGAIAFKYLFYAFTAVLLGSVLGLALGFTLIPVAIFQAYTILFLIPSMTPGFFAGTAAFGFGAALLFTMSGVVFPVLLSMRHKPAQLLRPKAPKAGKRVFLEWIPPLWQRLNFNGKVTVRNLMRNKKRFLMTFVGIMGCTALLLTGFGIGNSIGTMLDKQFGPESVMKFDAQALLTSPIPEGDTEAMRGTMELFDQPGRIHNAVPVYMKDMYAGTQAFGRQIKVVLAVPAYTGDINDFLMLNDEKTGKPLTFNNTGAFINGKTAELMDLSVGDEITLQVGPVIARVPVAGIVRNYVYHYIYMSSQAYEEFFGMEETIYNAVLLRLSPELIKNTSEAKTEKARLSRDLTDEAEIMALAYNSIIVDQVDSTLQIMRKVIVLVFTLAAGMLAFVVLYNLNNINIYERIRELATIKVLGFYDGEADMYIYRENIIISILGIGAGLLLGIPIHGFVVQKAEIESMMFVRQLAWDNYVWALAITVVFAIGINALMHKKIKNISMVESLKSVE
ncbi:MAG: hypothetical protein FWH26_03535 [Oscillospiraceae bacterium]|nr:hypothetical protein [Oscillospiraceae bacterium]